MSGEAGNHEVRRIDVVEDRYKSVRCVAGWKVSLEHHLRGARAKLVDPARERRGGVQQRAPPELTEMRNRHPLGAREAEQAPTVLHPGRALLERERASFRDVFHLQVEEAHERCSLGAQTMRKWNDVHHAGVPMRRAGRPGVTSPAAWLKHRARPWRAIHPRA